MAFTHVPVKGSTLPAVGAFSPGDHLLLLNNNASTEKVAQADVVTSLQGLQGIQGDPGNSGTNGVNDPWLNTVDRWFAPDGTVQNVGEFWVNSGSAFNSFGADATNLECVDGQTAAFGNGNVYFESFGLDYLLHTTWMEHLTIGRPLVEAGNIRAFIGFSSTTTANMLAASSPLFPHFGFRWDSDLDTNWMVVYSDGVAQVTIDTGIQPIVGDSQVFKIRWDNGGTTATFYLQGFQIPTVPIIPIASGTGLRYTSGLRSINAGGVKHFRWNFIKIRHGLI